MGRQEIINHITTELNRETENDTEDDSQPILCQQCGMQIASEDGTVPPEQGDYVVHRVPSHGKPKMNSVFYCGPSCFTDAMASLFSSADE